MENNNGFTIVIPAYNEAVSIETIIDDIKKLPGDYEIIIVDDGSTDGTFELIEKTGVRVLRHLQNKGYGASLKTGIKNAQYDTIVITDADATYPNERILELVKIFEDGDFDMVVGARVGKNVQIPLIRKPAKWFVNKLANYLTGIKIPDLNSGLRVMRKDVVEKFINILSDGFSFTATITLAMLTNNYNVKYIPINYFKREGKSKIRPIYDTLNFIQLVVRTVLFFDPLKIFVPISVFFMSISIILMFIRALAGGGLGVISVILFVLGVQLLAIGMLADLIDKRMR